MESTPTDTYGMDSSLHPDGQLNDTNNMTYSDISLILADFSRDLYTYQQPRTIVLICAYILVFFLAIAGNTLVFVLILCNRNMRSVTNYFLLNLSIADLLVTLVCIPLTVGESVYKVWIYGGFLCRATGYLQGVSIAASVLTIMALSIDRYVAIRHPVKSRRFSTAFHVKSLIILIWVIAGSMMLPLIFVRHLTLSTPIPGVSFSYCHEKWPSPTARRLFDIFLFVFIYVIPGFIVVSSYSATGCHLVVGDQVLQRQNSDMGRNYRIVAQRRRVARMLLILAILFAVSWLPYHTVSLIMNFSNKEQVEKTLVVFYFALLLGHSHSAQNPILYCIMSPSFKRGLFAILKCQQIRTLDLSRYESRIVGKKNRGLQEKKIERKVNKEVKLEEENDQEWNKLLVLKKQVSSASVKDTHSSVDKIVVNGEITKYSSEPPVNI